MALYLPFMSKIEALNYEHMKRIQQRLADLNAGDNWKLCSYLLDHDIEILYVTPDTICVNTKSVRAGKLELTSEIIGANMVSIRNYLGY